jgi:uncharacterized protein YbjT (DUF2867 family)
MTIAIMGAGGHVGSKLADLLLDREQPIRCLEHRRGLNALRERGADVRRGSAENVDDLQALFSRVDAAFVLLPEDPADPKFVATRHGIAHAVANALRARRVGHVVALSAVGVDQPDAAGPGLGLREFEQLLSGIPDANVLVLRSSGYMDYLLMNLPLIESQGINGGVTRGDVRMPWVATSDVAREAADRLIKRDFSGFGVRQLLGPSDVSMREATEVMGAALGRPDLPYVEFPPEGMKAALMGAGWSDQAAGLLVDMQQALNRGWPFDRIDRSTGTTTTATTLEDFLHAALAERSSR